MSEEGWNGGVGLRRCLRMSALLAGLSGFFRSVRGTVRALAICLTCMALGLPDKCVAEAGSMDPGTRPCV